MTVTKEPNIWDPLLDSLSYYQGGRYDRFEHCFKRVLVSLNLDLGNDSFHRLKQRFFRTATVLGFLEVDSSSLTRDWSLNPRSLLKTCGGYILISPP